MARLPPGTKRIPRLSEKKRLEMLGQIVEPSLAKARADDWGNVLTGLGRLGVDKTLGGFWTYRQVDQLSAQNMWRGDDALDRVVCAPPRDMLRQGFEVVVQDDKDVSTALNQKAKAMGLKKTLQTCLEWTRAYGGCGLLIGADDGARDLSLPLQEDRIRTFDYLTPFTPLELVPVTYYSDPLRARYGEVATWRLTPLERPPGYAPDLATLPVVHESRIIRFLGKVTSRGQILYNIHPGWGDSIFTMLRGPFQVFNGAFAGLGILVEDFAPVVLKMKKLAQLVAAQDATQQSIQRRAGGLLLGKSIANAYVIDSEEEVERKSTVVTGLADLLDRIILRTASAANMPVSLFMGQAASGALGGQSGETDISWYYDHLRAKQEDDLLGPLDRIFELMQKSKQGPTGGKVAPDWSIHFHPLQQQSAADLAKLHLAQAQSDQIYMQDQVLTPKEVRDSRFSGTAYSVETQLDEELYDAAVEPVGEGDVAAKHLGIRPEDIHPAPPPIVDIDKTQNLAAESQSEVDQRARSVGAEGVPKTSDAAGNRTPKVGPENQPRVPEPTRKQGKKGWRGGDPENPAGGPPASPAESTDSGKPLIPPAGQGVSLVVTAKTPQPQPIDRQVAKQVAESMTDPNPESRPKRRKGE